MFVSINDKNNLDYRMDLRHKEIGEASPRTRFVKVPFADGGKDITNAADPEVRFENRTITMVFEIREDRNEWASVMSELNNEINGRTVRLIFSDDTLWFWSGRATVSRLTDNGSTASVTISVNAEPHKRSVLQKELKFTFPSVIYTYSCDLDSACVIEAVKVKNQDLLWMFKMNIDKIPLVYARAENVAEMSIDAGERMLSKGAHEIYSVRASVSSGHSTEVSIMYREVTL